MPFQTAVKTFKKQGQRLFTKVIVGCSSVCIQNCILKPVWTFGFNSFGVISNSCSVIFFLEKLISLLTVALSSGCEIKCKNLRRKTKYAVLFKVLKTVTSSVQSKTTNNVKLLALIMQTLLKLNAI